MNRLHLNKHLPENGGHKSFSIRITKELADELDAAADLCDCSRNQVISILLEFALDNADLSPNLD